MTDHAANDTPAGHTADGGDPWPTIDLLHAWLDAGRAHGGREGLLLRILKLSEEVGEVAQAVIGATGQNPRKGVSHTWDDVRSELCDVVITAMVALRELAPDAREVFADRLTSVAGRSLGGAHAPASGEGPSPDGPSPDGPSPL
jgi:NTP pyrophosphatase (non-canonical NTP hydrolase)